MSDKKTINLPPHEKVAENRAKLLDLQKSGEFVFHGSLQEIEELEPRQAYNSNEITHEQEKDGAPAVFATQFADIAIFRSLVNAEGVSGGSTSHFGINNDELQFAATENLLAAAKGKKGKVYVLRKSDFDVIEDMQCRAHKKVIPVEVIEVSDSDLPSGIEILPDAPDAQVWVQAQPPWEDFGVNVDEEGKRKPATPEQIAEMNQRLAELSQVMFGAKFNWHLDGALNISLLTGKYIGYHKDVDISVEKEDLEQLEEQLAQNGYGLFLSNTQRETGERSLRRVGYKVFKDSDEEHMLIAAIDEQGRLRQDRALNFVDVHVVGRTDSGAPIGNEHLGVPIPEKWAQPYPLEYKGQTLNLSHPAKVLYFKLQQTRNYDATDIDRLIETGVLTAEDIDEISAVMEQEFVAIFERARGLFSLVSNKIDLGMSSDEIAKVFLEIEGFKRGGIELQTAFEKLGQEILETKDKSVDHIMAFAVKLFGAEEKNEQKRARLRLIRKAVEKQIALNQVRNIIKEK